MKTKSIIAALLLAASSAFAQVPSYVPTNGLVGWWPFNGNANDESGNGNNGTVNGATLSIDRYSNSNNSYYFDGTNKINLGRLSIIDTLNSTKNISYSIWFKANQAQSQFDKMPLITKRQAPWVIAGYSQSYFTIHAGGQYYYPRNNKYICTAYVDAHMYGYGINNGLNGGATDDNNWHNLIATKNNNIYSLYFDGILTDTIIDNSVLYSTDSMIVGYQGVWGFNIERWYKGNVDDIGIWNRALTQQEITALYTAQSCTSNTITADGPTTFCAGNFVNLASDVVGGTYQWKRNGVNIATNGTSRTYKATSSGSYTCVATCNGTALTSNAIQVTSQTNAAVTLTSSGATSFCAGDSVTLNATNLGSGYSVQWYRTNISMQGATNYSVVVKQPGTYKTVTRNLANGCSRISSGSIITAVNCRMSNPAIIAVDPVSDEIPATKLGNSIETTMHLFPNPNAGSFTLEYDGIEADFEVQVVNTMGQVIYNDIIPSNDKHLKTTINLGDNMQKGIYVVRIINGENVQESKVMLQ